jgi:hypothetical protein
LQRCGQLGGRKLSVSGVVGFARRIGCRPLPYFAIQIAQRIAARFESGKRVLAPERPRLVARADDRPSSPSQFEE